MLVSRINRYIAKELLLTWLSVSLVLISILLINRFVKFLGAAASGDLAADVIFLLLGLKALAYFSLVLPFTFFLACMLTLGRIGRDNEMAVLLACGVGPGTLYKSISFVFVPLLILVVFLSFIVSPWATNYGDKMHFEAQRDGPFASIESGRFIKSETKNGVFYVGEISDDRSEMKNVFAQMERDDKQVIISSDKAILENDFETGSKFIVFVDGYRYEGVPGEKKWLMTKFKRHGLNMYENPGNFSASQTVKTSVQLFNSSDMKDVSELHWRIAMPVMLVILVIIVLPLGKVSPREGRFGRLFIAIVVYLAYLKILTLARGGMERGAIPGVVGLWWVHVIFLIFGIFFYYKVFGMPKKRKGLSNENA